MHRSAVDGIIHASAAGRAGLSRRELLALSALGLVAGGTRPAGAAAPQGQLSWGIHVSLAPTWFDPAETSGIITPFMVLYALHDAMVKPMPGQKLAPCLAQSYTAAEDGLTYEFVLRDGIKFHNGEPVTAEDVRYSFERYKGASHDLMKGRVAAIETPDATHVRFRLKTPWPDFLTFYATATGAGWIVPKKYVEKVGPDGFKKAPIGAGPYKFVSFTPGVEMVLEAFDQYWRKTPSVKRIVFKVIPEETTRLAALQRGEVDIAYSIRGELAEQLRRTPGLTLKPVIPPAPFWLYFADQWDPKSPWHDLRVRQAANLALDRKAINDAITLGYSKITDSLIPFSFDYYWQPPAAVYDPKKAKELLAQAGLPNGVNAGELFCDSSYANVAEAALDNLQAAGIPSPAAAARTRRLCRGLGQQAFQTHDPVRQRRLWQRRHPARRLYRQRRPLRLWQLSRYRRAVSRAGKRARQQEARGAARKGATACLRESDFAPIWQLAFINGVGPRVGQSGFGLIADFAYTAPFEDITIKGA